MSTSRTSLLLAALVLAGSRFAHSQEMVKEPSTGKSFPEVATFTHEGTTHTLSLTGLTVRKKFFFKVYGMAHYAESPARGTTEEALTAMMVDGTARQITMDFARDVDAEKIKEAYADGFSENATSDELKEIQPLVNQFTGYFTKEVKENEQFILRWLPGGIVLTTVAGEEKPPLKNPVFARVLWSIWFGKNSIVDREELVERLSQ
ncbi:MAG: chalcone isomerase family protein [Bacteroidota bacterium]